MKKTLILLSIAISFIFTSFHAVSAKTGAIEGLLNLEFGPTQMQFTLSKMKDQKFSDPTLQSKHEKLRQINNTIIDAFEEKYKSGEIDYYSAHGLAQEQKHFAYVSTQLFKYFDLKIQGKTTIFDTKILEYYYKSTSSYARITETFDRTR